MELRQLRYFVKVCEHRSMGRAALELDVVTSALSQQISRLEGELGSRLLNRSSTGVTPTDAGLAFLQQAQLTLRHADGAVLAARQARLSGQVSVGLAPTTASILGLPLIAAMRERYPQVRLHLVEALSGHLATMLDARHLDLAITFGGDTAGRWRVRPLLDERLFLIAVPERLVPARRGRVRLVQLKGVPLILPSASHGLRSTLMKAFARAGVEPDIVADIDGLALLMDAVRAGLGATIQPGAALARVDASALRHVELVDAFATRGNLLASLVDQELSPAALATRAVLVDVVRQLVADGRWAGATLHES